MQPSSHDGPASFHRWWPAVVLSFALLVLYSSLRTLMLAQQIEHAEYFAKTPALQTAWTAFSAVWWLPLLLLAIPLLPPPRRNAALFLAVAILIVVLSVPVYWAIHAALKQGVIIEVPKALPEQPSR